MLTDAELAEEYRKRDFYISKYNLIVNAQKYSQMECHDISKWLCFMRDTDDEELKTRIETMLQAFINRKRLDIPVTTKQLEQEFNIPQ